MHNNKQYFDGRPRAPLFTSRDEFPKRPRERNVKVKVRHDMPSSGENGTKTVHALELVDIIVDGVDGQADVLGVTLQRCGQLCEAVPDVQRDVVCFVDYAVSREVAVVVKVTGSFLESTG